MANYMKVDTNNLKNGDLISFARTKESELGDGTTIESGKLYEVSNEIGGGYFHIDGERIGAKSMFADQAGPMTVYRDVSEVVAKEPKVETTEAAVGSDLAPGTEVDFRGDVYTISHRETMLDDVVSPGKAYRFTDGDWLNDSSFTVVDEDELKDGNKVRLLSGGGIFPLEGFINGEIYEVEYDKGDGRLRIIREGFPNQGFPNKHQVEKVSTDDIEKRIEAGDIVKVTDDVMGHTVGTLGKAVRKTSLHVPGWHVSVNGREFAHPNFGLELIVKKDNRADQ